MSPDPGARPVTQTSGRKLIDCLQEYLARPNLVERLNPVVGLFKLCYEMHHLMFQMAWTIAQRCSSGHNRRRSGRRCAFRERRQTDRAPIWRVASGNAHSARKAGAIPMTTTDGANVPRYFRRDAAARYVRENWGPPCSKAWLAKLAVVDG